MFYGGREVMKPVGVPLHVDDQPALGVAGSFGRFSAEGPPDVKPAAVSGTDVRKFYTPSPVNPATRPDNIGSNDVFSTDFAGIAEFRLAVHTE